MHGDAAFAGQGIWAETLNLADLKAYTVGGTIHIIVNNLIGFTTKPAQEHSSRFASDIAKRQSVPIFHVNAEDPDAVVRIGKLAAEYRATFGSDVVVDIIGYRRHGHSEVDDPTITQPLLYQRIKNHAPLWKIYAERTGIDSPQLTEGNPIPLTGQDTQRGTFNQRHAVLVEPVTEHDYLPLCHLSPNQAFCEVYNPSLSEAGCLGFEYGFSRDYPEALVLWEAQFGDFANGAQVIIDQFISAGEDKWNLPAGIVLLLPHPSQAHPPDHSSPPMHPLLPPPPE